MHAANALPPGLIEEEIHELFSSWQEAGSRLSFSVTTNFGRCSVEGCRAMAFVSLHTPAGLRPVCLRHHGILERDPEARERAP
jgi:hypothetical protein